MTTLSDKANTPAEHAIWLANVRQYLLARSWTFDAESSGNGLEVYALHTPDGTAVAWLPAVHASRDHHRLRQELIRLLEQVERRPGADIVEDITFIARDRVLVRIVGEDTDDGTVGAIEGQRVIESALNAAVAAAWALEKDALVLLGTMPRRVVEYQQSLRLGQTRRGSFVVSVYSPLRLPSESDATQLSMFSSPTGFPRDAVKRWLRQTAVARDIVSQPKLSEHDRLRAYIDAKISANLLDAIGDLANSSSAVEIRADFSPVAPESLDAVARVISVDNDRSASFKTSASLMRQRVPTERTIIGHVTQLNRRSDAFGDKVEIAALVDAKNIVISTELYGEHYKLALRLIEARSPIQLTGKLVRRGRWRLEELSDVRAFDAEGLRRFEEWRLANPTDQLRLDNETSELEQE